MGSEEPQGPRPEMAGAIGSSPGPITKALALARLNTDLGRDPNGANPAEMRFIRTEFPWATDADVQWVERSMPGTTPEQRIQAFRLLAQHGFLAQGKEPGVPPGHTKPTAPAAAAGTSPPSPPAAPSAPLTPEAAAQPGAQPGDPGRRVPLIDWLHQNGRVPQPGTPADYQPPTAAPSLSPE